jgi:signal transduction histidine kinase
LAELLKGFSEIEYLTGMMHSVEVVMGQMEEKMRQALRAPPPFFIKKLFFEPFNSVDRWFAALRMLVILGGFTWLCVAPLTAQNRILLLYNFLFFCIYSIGLYTLIFRYPSHLSKLYLLALFLDLIFLYWLVHYTGGFESDFFLGFFLLIALHSFYFGMRIGIIVVFLSCVVYLTAGGFDFTAISVVRLTLRFIFYLLVGVSMGLLSRKEEHDRKSINILNEKLEVRRRELEREKQKLENILVGIGAGIVLINRNMCIEWMNKVAESWFGALDDRKGMPCSTAIWGNSDHCAECPTQKSFQTGRIERTAVERCASQDRKFYRITSAPIRNEQGKTTNVLELIQDITQERVLQAQLLQSSKLAAIGELANGIAHEINNPLSSIAVCVEELAELYQDRNDNNAQSGMDLQECLQSIKNDIYRCKRITTGFLNFSRRKEARHGPTDINQLLMNTTLLTRHKAQKSHTEINFYLSSGLPLVMAEADEITQVFLNIIINAMDFTPPGKSIDVHTENFGEEKIAVRIVDRGPGIPEENLPKIFSSFFTTKPPDQGTGLGLPISRRIVEKHGGKIVVESKVDDGTTVTVILPIGPDSAMGVAVRNDEMSIEHDKR